MGKMIKILFFIETLTGGGAEKVLCDLVNHMDQTKFDITVQTLWPSEAEKKLADGVRYKCIYGKYSRLNDLRMRIESALGLTYRLHIKDDYDIECAYLEMGSTKIMSASTNKKAKKLAWVHCDLAKAVGDPAAFVRKAARWYAKFDKAVCVSEDVRKSFEMLFDVVTPAVVVHNTIDDLAIKESAEMPLPADIAKQRTTVVTLGRLTHQKGYDRLLDAHRHLIMKGLKYDLWILGEGKERLMLETYVREHRLQDTVRFFGFQSNPYPFIREADLVACSSRYEGFSTVAAEAVILGKPVVTTDCTGMREILGDSEYGLVTENDDDAFFEGLKKMLEDPELRRAYGEKAAARGKDFSASALTRETERFLTELLKEQQ